MATQIDQTARAINQNNARWQKYYKNRWIAPVVGGAGTSVLTYLVARIIGAKRRTALGAAVATLPVGIGGGLLYNVINRGVVTGINAVNTSKNTAVVQNLPPRVKKVIKSIFGVNIEPNNTGNIQPNRNAPKQSQQQQIPLLQSAVRTAASPQVTQTLNDQLSTPQKIMTMPMDMASILLGAPLTLAGKIPVSGSKNLAEAIGAPSLATGASQDILSNAVKTLYLGGIKKPIQRLFK